MANNEEEMKKLFYELRKESIDVKGISQLDNFQAAKGRFGSELTFQNVYVVTKEVPDPEHPSDSFLAYEIYSTSGEKMMETDPQTSELRVGDKYKKMFEKQGVKIGENNEVGRKLFQMQVMDRKRDESGEIIEENSNAFVTSDNDGKKRALGEKRDTMKKGMKAYIPIHQKDMKNLTPEERAELGEDGEEETKDLSVEELKEKKEAETGKKVTSFMYIEDPIFYNIASSCGKASYKTSVVQYEDGTYDIVNSHGDNIAKQEKTGDQLTVLTDEGEDHRLVLNSFRIGSYVYYVTMNENNVPELAFNEDSKRGEVACTVRTNNIEPDATEMEYAKAATTDTMDLEETKIAEVLAEEGITTVSVEEVQEIIHENDIVLDDDVIADVADDIEEEKEETMEEETTPEEVIEENELGETVADIAVGVATAAVGGIALGAVAAGLEEEAQQDSKNDKMNRIKDMLIQELVYLTPEDDNVIEALAIQLSDDDMNAISVKKAFERMKKPPEQEQEEPTREHERGERVLEPPVDDEN